MAAVCSAGNWMFAMYEKASGCIPVTEVEEAAVVV